MSGWSNSDRRSRLPGTAEWERIRTHVRRRAKRTSPLRIEQCEWVEHGQRCTNLGSECDHIEAKTDDHRPEACQWLCPGHHKVKTAAESKQARAAKKAQRYRPQQTHPGRRPTR